MTKNMIGTITKNIRKGPNINTITDPAALAKINKQATLYEKPSLTMKIGNMVNTGLNTAGDAYNAYNSLLGDSLNAVHNSIASNNNGFSDPFLFASALAAGAKARGIVGSIVAKGLGSIVSTVTGGGALGNINRASKAELLSKINNADPTQDINGAQLGEIRKIAQGV